MDSVLVILQRKLMLYHTPNNNFVLIRGFFSAETTHVDWPAEESSVPNPRWIWMLWTFLREEFDRILAKQTGPVDDEELAKVGGLSSVCLFIFLFYCKVYA